MRCRGYSFQAGGAADKVSEFQKPATWTRDTFLGGRLKVCQSRRGYRFSLDALILAFHAEPGKGRERILDLGTGCGILPLVTATRFPEVHLTGVEIQPELAALARFNVEQNAFQERILILEEDYLQLPSKAVGPPVDMVIANPPYRRPRSGRVNPEQQRALARHEIAVSLEGLIKTMRRFLKTGGRGWIVYTADRLAELMSAMQSHHMEPKYLRLIHSRPDSEAKRCLLKVVKGARPGMTAGPPLVIYGADGAYTDEVSAMFDP